MRCTCCEKSVPLPRTPDDILLYDGVDVFKETIGTMSDTKYQSLLTNLTDTCWLRFRSRPLGNYDYTYWMQCFLDKCLYEWRKYVKTLDLMLDSNNITLRTYSEIVTVTSSDVEDISGSAHNDTDTQGDSTVGIDGTNVRTPSLVTSGEDQPDIAAGTTQYLSNRTTVSGTEGVVSASDEIRHETAAITGDNTSQSTAAKDHNENSERSVYDGLPTEQLLKLMDLVDKLNDRFTDKLDHLFMNRW